MYKGPRILSATDLLDRGLGRAAKLSRSGARRIDRERNTAIARLRTAADIFAGDLDAYVKGFPSFARLHPFHAELAAILLDLDRVRHAIGAADWCASGVRRVTREGVRRLARADGLPALLKEKRAAYGRMTSLVKQIAPELEVLAGAAATLRRIPAIDPELPTIVIAGAPNVGKSALVRKMSSGKPRVAAYPFTTKALSVGHFDLGVQRFQVIDTPGLLDRAEEKRNPIERQAAAALRQLAHVVVFLTDPTEACGTLMAAQEQLLAHIREEFPRAPLLEVENKADLLKTGSGRRKVSAVTGAGVEALRRLAAQAVVRKATPQA
ncbi:MAG TPA: GTPase [Thermoplasmata archaeon]|nr:GTPase [Thermoplasmata archaeon]